MARARFKEWLTERGLGMIEGWAGDGLDDQELAKAMKISTSTLYEWKRKYPAISEALNRGRGGAQVQIENALFQKAKGFHETIHKPMKRRVREYDPETKRCIREEEVVDIVEEEIYIPPDTNAAKFWLTNKAPTRWTEKVLVEGEGSLRLEDLLDG